MHVMSRAVRLCGAVVTAAVLFAGWAVTPARASDDLPIVGDIPMPQVHLPEVHVSVRLADDLLPPPQPRFVYPRGPFAAIPPARFEQPIDGPSVPPVEVARMLRSTGYSLLGQINRRGWVYTVAVLNPRGDDGRAVIDARTGAIIRFIPALAVNARLNDELGVIYGPPGPPPVVQDFSRAPRPPKPVPRVAKRDAAPKLADRMPASAQPTPQSATSPIPAKSEPAKSEAAKPVEPVQQTASTQTKPVEIPAEVKPAPQPDVKPSTPELLPTQQMPDVQPLD